MDKKRVLYLTSGVTPYRSAFFQEMAKQVELTVLYELRDSQERQWIVEAADKALLTEVSLKAWKKKVNSAFCPEVIKYLKKDYDHIIIGGYSTPTGMLAILWLRMHRKKFVLNADGGIIKQDSPLKEWIKRFFISSAEWCLSTGKQTTDYFLHYGAHAERIYEYPFTSVFRQDLLREPLAHDSKEQNKAELGIPYKKMILAVGQFIHRKGNDILLRACEDLDPETCVYIVGGKPTEAYIELREELGLKNVHFVDFMQKEELMKYYLAADFFVLPTREDIWGLVVNEALAKALPVITTDRCVAGLELVRNGKNGYIVPVEDVSELAQAMKQVLYGDMQKMAQAALDSIRNYTIEDMALRHIEILEEIEKR